MSTVTDLNTNPVRERLEQARDHLAAAGQVLTARMPAPAELHAAVEGAMRVSTALAELVTTVMQRAPTTFDGRGGPLVEELLADLRAMHGCLTTGTLLLAPARDDLHRYLTQPRGPAMFDDTRDDIPDAAPAPDVADQQRPARPEPAEDEQGLLGVGEVLEADPADVADQRRDAPVLEDGEPWP